ncbi:hypothetical protein OPKNFCMD_0632 [Methylobacterium crusticola]|uniref:CAAX prenyl protease 2/Lysostaphin resistance protein A-like domain-containing protein n=1 Tax=Methylobacterium crusticola TaxID=1697972 RepID=A0ABQ4QT21_9HYPH|nr:type II CAAX endopeptidase family protein [Methylobacterium crusticola]GJD47920.1 hypothetical protein OPKNFCMD_0632 [Methylobacterium crusticola]
MPLLKPAEPHSASASPPAASGAGTAAAGAPREAARPGRQGPAFWPRTLRVAGLAARAALLQVAAFALAFGLVAAARWLLARSGLPVARLPFGRLGPEDAAAMALTLAPPPVLALLVLWRARAREGRGWAGSLALRRPVLRRRALSLLVAWPFLQVAWTAGLLVLLGQSPARAWRLSPAIAGEVLWAWALWLVVLAPLAEELLFRGDLFGRLRGLLPPAATVLASAGVFALCHAERGLTQPLSVLPLGLALGLMRLWTGSLWPCIVLHAVSNGAVVLAMLWASRA